MSFCLLNILDQGKLPRILNMMAIFWLSIHQAEFWFSGLKILEHVRHCRLCFVGESSFCRDHFCMRQTSRNRFRQIHPGIDLVLVHSLCSGLPPSWKQCDWPKILGHVLPILKRRLYLWKSIWTISDRHQQAVIWHQMAWKSGLSKFFGFVDCSQNI